MDATPSREEQALSARISQLREKLDGLARDLRAADGELEALAAERQQYALLEQACSSLEKLRELGVSGLFWGERVPGAAGAEHVREVCRRVASFQQRVDGIESRRLQIVASIGREEEALGLLADDLYDAQQQEERRKLEWIIERDVDPVQERPQTLAWARIGEEDTRFRKTLAATMLAALIIGALLPMIDLPLPTRTELIAVPERVAQLVQERARIVPPPPVQEVRPDEQPPEPEQKPTEKPEPAPDAKPSEQLQPGQADEPQLAAGQPSPEKKGPVGILAFRDKFSSLRQSTLAPRLGSQARITNADDDSVGRTQRSMLTTNAPGSSGGINLASLSRDVGGGGRGGGSGAMQGVAVTRASSGIGGSGPGGGDRPLSGGAGPSRTDEEIQIVFDRYKAALYRLYNRELRKDPTLQGQMVLRLTIEPDGTVSFCQLQSTDMNAPDLSAQVVSRVKTFNFGAKEVPAITIVYPIDFLPAA